MFGAQSNISLKRVWRYQRGNQNPYYVFCHVHKLLFAWLTDNSSYFFLASELSIEKKIKYSRQAANNQSMGFAINISHA